jgi:hypothetical protein
MVNYVGKTLVFVNLLLSGAVFAWALAVYTQKVDWGWKDPRMELGERVPSEIDKRSAALQEALAARSRAVQEVEAAGRGLAVCRERLPFNHEWYKKQLEELDLSGAENLAVLPLQFDKKGLLVVENVAPPANTFLLDPGALGRPVLDKAKVAGVSLSLTGYRGKLASLHGEMVTIGAKIQELIGQQEKLTKELNGGEDADKRRRPGYLQLLQDERKTQEQLKEEVVFLLPFRARESADAQLLLERRQQLQERLVELKAASERRKVAGR